MTQRRRISKRTSRKLSCHTIDLYTPNQTPTVHRVNIVGYGGQCVIEGEYDATLRCFAYVWVATYRGQKTCGAALNFDLAKLNALNALALMSITKPPVIAIPETPKTAAASMPRWKLSNTDCHGWQAQCPPWRLHEVRRGE